MVSETTAERINALVATLDDTVDLIVNVWVWCSEWERMIVGCNNTSVSKLFEAS